MFINYFPNWEQKEPFVAKNSEKCEIFCDEIGESAPLFSLQESCLFLPA
jgi:hypothetical protein